MAAELTAPAAALDADEMTEVAEAVAMEALFWATTSAITTSEL